MSAKELERQLGVTYKCSWRIANKIRTLFNQNRNTLKGIFEIDEMYQGGRDGSNKQGGSAEKKTPVIGAVERKGNVSTDVCQRYIEKPFTIL